MVVMYNYYFLMCLMDVFLEMVFECNYKCFDKFLLNLEIIKK